MFYIVIFIPETVNGVMTIPLEFFNLQIYGKNLFFSSFYVGGNRHTGTNFPKVIHLTSGKILSEAVRVHCLHLTIASEDLNLNSMT